MIEYNSAIFHHFSDRQARNSELKTVGELFEATPSDRISPYLVKDLLVL